MNIPKEQGFEFEGNTIEEAIKLALETLKIGRDEIVVKVMCEEKRGLFGMEGAKPAKIKVFLKNSNEKS